MGLWKRLGSLVDRAAVAGDALGADPLERVREICLGLPDTRETRRWGSTCFRAEDQIFADYAERGGRPSVSFKLEADHAAAIVADARFRPSTYVGRLGWVTMDLAGVDDWSQVTALLVESFHLVAPERTLAKLA